MSQITSSQNTEEQFHEGPWLRMKEELEPKANEIVGKYNLSKVAKMVRIEQPTELLIEF